MTLREIFNAIIDYPLELDLGFNSWWVVAAYAVLVVVAWVFMYWWYDR